MSASASDTESHIINTKARRSRGFTETEVPTAGEDVALWSWTTPLVLGRAGEWLVTRLSNIHGTPAYDEQLAWYEPLFASRRVTGVEEVGLPFGYRIVRTSYAATRPVTYGDRTVTGHLSGSKSVVLAEDGHEVFRFTTTDDDAEFVAIISHRDSHRYLVYRPGLYGYGVFDLDSGRSFVHVPGEQETFIWTRVDYLRANDLLVASGCYWACPDSFVLLDFSEPLAEHPWVEAVEQLGYDEYDNADFMGFDGTTLLAEALCVSENPSRNVALRIPEDRYRAWLEQAGSHG
jgi:hypothetical protein